MKILLKILLIVILFVAGYFGIMTVAYDYLYPYPVGILDEIERADEARFYRCISKTKVDDDTLVFFSRSNNGVGTDIHFGTLDSNMPDILANKFCTLTSSIYMPTETIAYTIATSDDKTVYLFGATGDMNTESITVTFYDGENAVKEYEAEFKDGCYFVRFFDTSLAQYPCSVTGYNEEGYATFEYFYQPLMENVPGQLQ